MDLNLKKPGIKSGPEFNVNQQCCGSWSGIRYLFDLGSWIQNRFFQIPDLGTRIPNPYFESLVTNFWVKSTISDLPKNKIFLPIQKYNYLQFYYICGYKKMVEQKMIFSPPLLELLLDPGSEIRDPGTGRDKNQDPGSRINIPDPQHC
jgi:hypothetical protein